MNPTLITGGQIMAPDNGATPETGPATGSMTIVDGRIDSLASTDRPDQVIDADGLIVAPGLVDLQVNGAFGIDLQSDPDAMWELGRLMTRHGVTSYLPTIVSGPPTGTAEAMAALGRRPTDFVGAEPLGLHFEGPMLSPARPGAHAIANLVTPNQELIESWSRASGVALVTMAPELDGADPIMKTLVDRGVVVSAGHSDATAAEARHGVDAGATMVTHLFNTMPPFGHRTPGLIGLALTDTRVTAGLIVDGVHVDPVAVALAWRAKGPTGIALVTDASTPMGLGPGRYDIGAMTVVADDDTVRTLNGTLAGSLLTMDRAVRNVIEYTGCDLADAITAAATTPAEAIGHTDRGRLQPGAVADVALFDQNLEVAMTICAGRVAHVAAGAEGRITAHREP